jgi:hypothetical protein
LQFDYPELTVEGRNSSTVADSNILITQGGKCKDSIGFFVLGDPAPCWFSQVLAEWLAIYYGVIFNVSHRSFVSLRMTKSIFSSFLMVEAITCLSAGTAK